MGGYSTLRVAVAGVSAAESVHVAATALWTPPGIQEVRRDTASADCVGAACADGVGFNDFAPDTVAISVATPARRVRHVVAPRYESLYPNGPGCGPALRSGSVVVPADP